MIPSNLETYIVELESMVVWKPCNEGEIPEPQPGLDESFDKANNLVTKIKAKLDCYLGEVRDSFNDERINWSHAKYRYELEIPIEIVEGDKKPEHFEFTSAKKDFQRFHTKEIKKIVEELENAEEKLREAFTPFLKTLFTKFHEKKFVWDSLVNIIAELDCLVSHSILSG